MDTSSSQHVPLPAGFHWEVLGAASTRHMVAVPDALPDVWLASIGDDASGCIATIRRHKARASHIDRPFRTAAAAAGWVARWLDRQGGLIRAELATDVGEGMGPRLSRIVADLPICFGKSESDWLDQRLHP